MTLEHVNSDCTGMWERYPGQWQCEACAAAHDDRPQVRKAAGRENKMTLLLVVLTREGRERL